ncbi:MAG: phage tail protein [Rhizobiales bacterium]|nr:phage tail protein [Hyphomicrobiales bacterium]
MNIKNFSPVQTDVGYAAMLNGQLNGNSWEIVAIAIGDANGVGYVPQPDQTALKNEKMRVPVLGGEKFAEGFRVIANFPYDPNVGEVELREIGFIMKNDADEEVMWSIYCDTGLKITTLTEGFTYTNSYNVTITRGNANNLVLLPPVNNFQAFNLDFSTGIGLASMRNSAALINQIITNNYKMNGA